MPVSLIRPMRYPDDGEALGALYQACHATWPKRAPLWWFTHPTLVLEDHGALIGSTSFSLSLPRPLS